MRLDLVGTGAVGARPRADRVRHPALGNVGLRAAQAGRARVARPVAGDLADPRRRGRALALPRLGEPADRPGRRAAGRPRDPARSRCCAAASPRSSSSTCCRPGCSSRCRCSCRSRSGSRRSTPGVRLLPLSITLLLAAAGIPKLFPNASPRRVVQLGFLALFAGLVVLVAALDAGAGPEIVDLADAARRPRRSARSPRSSAASPSRRFPTSRAARSAACRTRSPTSASRSARRWPARSSSPRSPPRSSPASSRTPPCRRPVTSQAQTELAGGVPFISDADLKTALDEAPACPRRPPTPSSTRTRPRGSTGCARRSSVLAVFALVALFFSRRLPTVQPAKAAEAPQAAT